MVLCCPAPVCEATLDAALSGGCPVPAGKVCQEGGVLGLTPVTGGVATQQGEERRHSLVMAQTHGIRQVFLVRVACPSTVAAAARHSPSHTWHHRV